MINGFTQVSGQPQWLTRRLWLTLNHVHHGWAIKARRNAFALYSTIWAPVDTRGVLVGVESTLFDVAVLGIAKALFAVAFGLLFLLGFLCGIGTKCRGRFVAATIAACQKCQKEPKGTGPNKQRL